MLSKLLILLFSFLTIFFVIKNLLLQESLLPFRFSDYLPEEIQLESAGGSITLKKEKIDYPSFWFAFVTYQNDFSSVIDFGYVGVVLGSDDLKDFSFYIPEKGIFAKVEVDDENNKRFICKLKKKYNQFEISGQCVTADLNIENLTPRDNLVIKRLTITFFKPTNLKEKIRLLFKVY